MKATQLLFTTEDVTNIAGDCQFRARRLEKASEVSPPKPAL